MGHHPATTQPTTPPPPRHHPATTPPLAHTHSWISKPPLVFTYKAMVEQMLGHMEGIPDVTSDHVKATQQSKTIEGEGI